MDFNAAILRMVDDHARAIAARKETMIVCALVDLRPALRWVEWAQDDGSVAHILISGGKGLGGEWVDGFRGGLPPPALGLLL